MTLFQKLILLLALHYFRFQLDISPLNNADRMKYEDTLTEMLQLIKEKN